MSLAKYIARLQRMDSLIAMKATGPPEVFAYKMNLSRSMLFETPMLGNPTTMVIPEE